MNEQIVKNIYNKLQSDKLTTSTYDEWKNNFIAKPDVQKNVHNYLFSNNLTKNNFDTWKNNILPVSQNYQWSSVAVQNPYTIAQPSQVDLLKDIPENILSKAREKASKIEEGRLNIEFAESIIDPSAIYKISQKQLDVSDNSLKEEAEYGMNRSYYSNTQKVVNVVNQSFDIINNGTPDDINADLEEKLKLITSEKESLNKELFNKKDIINKQAVNNKYLTPEQQKQKSSLDLEYAKKQQELDNQYVSLKALYTKDSSKKFDPFYNTVLNNTESINELEKLTKEQLDEQLLQFGIDINFIGESAKKSLYKSAYELTKLNNKGLPSESIEAIKRRANLLAVNNLSSLAKEQNDFLTEKINEINEKYGIEIINDTPVIKEGVSFTKEDLDNYKQEIDNLKPLTDNLQKTVNFTNRLGAKIKTDYKSLQYREDLQTIANSDWEKQGWLDGIGYAVSENISSKIDKWLVSDLLINQFKENPEVESLITLEKYKYNQPILPTDLKTTPIFTIKNGKVEWGSPKHLSYNIAKVSLETAEIAALALLSGGTSLGAQAGLTSLKGILSGIGSRASIVGATMALTSGEMILSEYEKGLSPSQAFKVGLTRSFFEGLTEIVNPIEITGLDKLTKVGSKLGKEISEEAYTKVINDAAKSLIGRTFSKETIQALLGFTGEIVKAGAMETVEEEIGLFLNALKDKQLQKVNPEYEGEEFTLENIISTAINTMISSVGLGGFQAYGERNGILNSAKFQAAENPTLYLNRLEQDLQDKTLTQIQYQAAKDKINQLSSIYSTNKTVIDNLEDEEQVDFLITNEKSLELSKILPTLKENQKEKVIKDLEQAQLKIANYTQKALGHASKTPIEKQEFVENQLLDNLNSFYNEEFISKVTEDNVEQITEDLLKKVAFLPTAKIKQKVDEVLVKIDEHLKKPKEEAVTEEAPPKSVFEQTKENIASFSKEKLESYNPFTDKNLSKEEKKEINNLKLQRLQELEDEDTNVKFGDKTFKKGEQVTLDEGKTYWNVEDLTEDGRLKLSRKFDNATESTTVSNANDVKPYTFKEKETKETSTGEFAEQEELFDVFGKPQQEEIPTEDIEIVTSFENLKNNKQVFQSPAGKFGILSTKDNKTIIWSDTLNQAIEKADIERRRQEELKKAEEQRKPKIDELKQKAEEDIKRTGYVQKITRDRLDSQEGLLFLDKDKINAKYDAELAALEQPKVEEQITELVVEQEVSSVKPQEPEKAKKQQDKEVKEKFEAPATPFKNGKVKTSNWNTVLSTITPTELLNYRVKVVNTNSLKFEDLPYQTQQYFEEQAIKNKTSVKDVMSKDKGKMLVLTDKQGNIQLFEGKPVISNFPDGLLAEYKTQFERQGLSEEQYFNKIAQIKEARKNNSTLLIDKISNYPIEITQDTNELSVAIGNNDFSITKGSKGFPVAKVGEQEINLISRKLNQDEIDSIAEIAFYFGSSGVYDQKSNKITTEQKNNSERFQKLQYIKNIIFTGDGVTKAGNKKLNFQYFIKSPEYGFSTKITYGNEEIKTKEELKKILKLYEININKDLSESLVNFTTYKIEDGKVVVDKEYKPKKISDTVTLTPYKQFLLDNIKTKGTSATKLQDNFYIEVGDVDNTLAAEITKATEEKAPEPAITEKPVENTEIVKQSPALDEFNDILNEKEKPIDPLAIDDDFTGLLRSRKLSQEATAEQNKKAKEWYENSPLKNFITLNQLQNIVNSDAYASWNWGAISLFKGSQYTDLYHEAWHEFSQLYLTKKQKEALYNEVRNLPQYKGFTNKQIEEVIAEDFRNYALSNGKLILNNRYKRNSIFRKIWNFLKEWVTGKTDLQTVYDRLYTGNVSKYKRNLNNAFWGNLNLGITTQDGKQLSDTDTKNLYRAIDSLVGKIFQQNGKPVTIMFADNKVLSVVYGAIYKNFVNRRNAILKTLQEKAKQNLSEEEKQKLRIEKQTFYNLKDITDNWNTVVQNHKKYSAFFNISKDKISFDEEGNIVSIDDKLTEETDEGNSRESELIKNENVSSKEAASNETIFTIATLPRYNSDGTRAINPFLPFVQDIVDFNSTWDKLTTATNNHLEYSQVLSKIEELGQKDKSFQDLLQRLPNSEKSLTDDEQRMKAAFMNDISKPLVQVYELIMTPVEGKMFFAYKTAASSDLDKIKRQWNDNFEATSPFIKQNPDDSLYLDKEEIKSIYGAKGSKPAFYYNKQDYEKADKKQMFENRIDFLSKIGVTFTEEILSDPEFQDLITKDFVKTVYTNHSSVFTLYELITKSKEDISSLPQLSKVKPSPEFKYFAKAIEELANFELLGSNNLFAQSVKNAEQNSVWQIRQWNYITKVFNALNDVEKYPTYQDLQKEEWLQQFNFEVNPYVKGIYLNTLFDLNSESPTYGQRRVIKKGNKTIYPTISLHDYNGMRLNLADNKTNEGKGTTSLTAFEKIIQNINSLLLFNTQENLRYGDKSSSFSTSISYYINTKTGKLEERKSIIPFGSFINKREAIILPEEAFKYLVADLRQEIIPMIKFEHEQIGSNLKHYNKNIKNFGTFDGILSKETKDAIKKQIITPNIQDPKQIDKILFELPLREEFETYITDKSKQLSDLLDTQGILEDVDIFDSRLIQENIKTPEGKTISQPLPKQSMLYGYIVNSLLYNIEHTKIISFDPRFYKNPKDVIKRLSAWSATGNIFVVDEQTNNYIDNKGNAIKDAVAKKLEIEIPKIFPDGKIRSVIFKDNEYSASKLFENYKEKFLATGRYTSEQLNTVLKAYNSVNEADGQGYVTLDLLRESKLRAGSSHWTKAHEDAYQKEAKFLAGESTEGMTSEEMTLFTPQKWQEAGIGLTNENIPYPSFYKFSVVPLIPSAIKGTNFEKIHENLIKQNVGLALFESGSKASGVLDENGKYNPFYSDYEKRTPYLGEYTINTVFFQYLKEQVNVEPELKEEVSFSTQMRKLLHLNLYNNGVPNDVSLSPEEWNKLSKSEKLKQSPIYKSEQRFADVIENLIKIEQESIIKKMGATKQPDGNYKLDAEKLAEFFKEEFIKRDLPNEVVNYLQAFEGEFLFPIDAFKQRATIERIAYSIANKKLVQQKITGEALVQVASTGFEITDKFSSVKEDSDLPFYTEPGKAQKVKIAFTERWKPLLNLEYKGEKIKTIDRLNEAIKDEKWLEQNHKAITIVGVRIPVQGLNSQEFMEVYHFLPESMGGIIVVSPALVAKSGGDFDIDKLTTFFPNLNKNGKIVVKQSEEQLKKVYNNIVNKYKKEDKDVDKLISAIFGITEEELQEELIQELIENKEIIPFEQFKNIQNKKAYENELIDIIRETLSREDNFLQLVRPNDTDLLKNKEYGADKLKELFPKPYQDNTFTSVVDFGSIIEEFKSNLVGKSNLGIAAVNNVLFALAQRAGLHHNETFTYRNFNGKFETKAVEYYLPHNKIKVGDKELVSLSGLFSKDSNNYISDIISQYINGFVDVAKDDWVFFIGGVREFVPTMLYTALAGTNAKTTIAFFNQPIMREYIKNVDKYKNLFTKLKSPEDYNMGNWKALQDAVLSTAQKDIIWANKYPDENEIKEDYDYFIKSGQISKSFEKYKEEIIQEYFFEIYNSVKKDTKPDFLTEEKLSDALYNNNLLTPEQEIFLILHFWELKKQAGILTNLQRSLNADTKKVGSGYSSIERQTMFKEVLKSNLFNADAMYRMRNESTIKAFTNDKTGFDTFSQQLFTDLFEVTNHPTFNKVIRELVNNDRELNYEFKFSKLEKLVNTIKNDFITYLYQNQVLDGNDNLFKKTQPLFNPKSSIALELKDIKEKYPNLSQEFPILDLIIPDNYKIDNRILKVNLKLKHRLADKDELDNAVFQIRQLQTFNSVKYIPEQQIEIQQFTDRLIKFIIVQSGLNPSVYNLLDIIPNEAYTQNIKSIIKDVQKALNKDINTPFALKSDKKSPSQKSLEKFYNRFKIENPAFYKFEPTDEEVRLNFINQRGKNYYLPTTDITGAKAKEAEDKLLAYLPTLPAKSKIVDKNNGQTLKQNPKSLFVVYDNKEEVNKKALNQQKITNFATMVAIDKDTIDRQLDEIISKSMDYESISFNLSKGYFQDIKESNPELFNYASQRLKDTFGINNLGFEEVSTEQEVIEQPINKEIVTKTYDKKWKDGSNTNKATSFALKNKPNEIFELVNDKEDGFYSLHIKTTDKNSLTEDEKQQLIKAVANTIPIGGKLSSWGEATKGGLSGLNRFKTEGFVEVGDRKVSDNQTIPILEKKSINKEIKPKVEYKDWANKVIGRFSLYTNEVLKKDQIENLNHTVDLLIQDFLKVATFAKEDLKNRQYLPFINRLKENGFKQVEGKEWLLTKNGVSPEELYKQEIQEQPIVEETKEIPTQEVKPGVQELFNENPELANEVYEALGLSKKLDFYKGDTLAIDEKIYSIVEKISSKELAKRNGLTISSNIPVYIVSEFLGARKGGYDTVNNIIILSKDSDKETIHHELIHSVEYNLDKSELNPLYEKVKNSITEDSFDGFISWNFRKNISEFVADALSKKAFRNALKKEGLLEEVDNVLSIYTSGTTPQQKQQAQQLYSQYLESLSKPNTNPILQGSKQEQVKKFVELQERLNNKEFIEGAKNAYESSKGLQELGTQKEYNDYIARVSLGIIKNPSSGEYNYTSKVKDIVYHGTGEKFDIFDFKLVGQTTKGFANAAFFTNNRDWAFSRFALSDTHQVWGKKGVVLSALLNVKNPKSFDTVFDFNKSLEEGVYKNLEEELNEKLRDIFPPIKSGKIYFVVNLNKQLKPEFKFVDENQREEKYSQLTGNYTVSKNITEQEYLNTLSKEEKDNFLIKKQKLNDIISSYSTNIDKAIKGLTTKTAALSGKEDSVIQTHPNTSTKEYAVFEPEQIHILSSKQDIEGFKKFVSKPTQEVDTGIDTSRKINIYAGTGENAELSNFAIRPFEDKTEWKGLTFKSVEGAFQAAKIQLSDMYDKNDNLTKEGDALLDKLQEASGAEAKALGRKVTGLNTREWDRLSSYIMKGLLLESFKQNPKALERLLATGNAELTHTQDKGKWGKEFPKLLMEVRQELSQPTSIQEENKIIEELGEDPLKCD